MAKVSKYDLSGQQIGDITFDDAALNLGVHPQLIKEYITAIRANQRQWSANTKGRSEVNHTKKKPHAQKGTGRARQGSLASPQYKGGGVVFGPKPKFDQHVKVNKKQKRAAVKALLSEFIQNDALKVLSVQGMEKPRTKAVVEFLKATKINGKKVLVLGEAFEMVIDPEEALKRVEQQDLFVASIRNIPKTFFKSFVNVSGYELASAQEVVVLDSAVEDLQALLSDAS